MDYITAHLSWIKNNPQFVPQGYAQFSAYTYFEIMTELYANPRVKQNHAEMLYEADQLWLEKCSQIKKTMFKRVKTKPTTCFVTIGFNHQTWSIQSCIDVINKIKSFDWVKSFQGCFELHRQNGEHPHCHMIIDTDETKSKVLEKIWATKGIKKIVLKKSFIDYKVCEDYHYKYIHGDKIESKILYVNKDNLWRVQNDIPHLFEK